MQIQQKWCLSNEQKHFFNNINEHSPNYDRSIVFDLLNTAYTFGCQEEIRGMLYRDHIWSRTHWSEKIWARAWELEETFWCLKSRCHKSLELLMKVCTSTRYVIWWQIADNCHELMRECEIMVKLLCHSSLLKTDDVRLKSLPIAARFCTSCEYGSMDDAHHLVMQCPSVQDTRTKMFKEITDIPGESGRRLLVSGEKIFIILMGRPSIHVEPDSMVKICKIAAKNIAKVYRNKIRQGIG